MAKIKDLDKWLSRKTGLNKDQRVKWRTDIEKLMARGEKAEDLKCFNDIGYWIITYKNKSL